MRLNYQTQGRQPLNKSRVLTAAVASADKAGLEALSMRSLAEQLGVVPMALYKHVANKEELIDGMIDVVIGEIEPPRTDLDWRGAVRQRILSARQALLRHPWTSRAMESRSTPTPVVLGYMDSMIAMFLAGGFSIDLTHHAMHALGSRMFGFSQELYTGSQNGTPDGEAARQLALMYPNIAAVAMEASHDHGSKAGPGCDDQFEFEFALDLVLDGFELLRQRGWQSANRQTGLAAA
jgi:AcrR family transcriptional regulator